MVILAAAPDSQGRDFDSLLLLFPLPSLRDGREAICANNVAETRVTGTTLIPDDARPALLGLRDPVSAVHTLGHQRRRLQSAFFDLFSPNSPMRMQSHEMKKKVLAGED
ncbi:hypothetical protein GGTG_12937, partial [Gaeumannomyces tritici R3-111a-1]